MDKMFQVEISEKLEWEQMPLKSLPLSKGFIQVCGKAGWHTMADLFNAGSEIIAAHPKITDLWFEELLCCLKKEGLLYRLKP
ncbi:hypothetical protein [Olivibacter jilunii]|uniref:hypothetical protein n=1 Tax=Olivibacter jilunii TaxID=985016 RepID=UPI001030BA48|nr:hypothetical protein [Olivibacter jilunii]